MTVLDHILAGFEAELELERELGVRTVEIDRALLSDRVGSVRVELGSNRVGLGSDRVEVGSVRVELGSNRVEIGSNRVRLGSDRVEIGSSRVEIGSDRAIREPRFSRDNRTIQKTLSDSAPTLKDPTPTLKDPNPTLPDPNSTLKDPNRLYDFVFLHDKALSPGGADMISKAVIALGKTAEAAPVVFEGALPRARFYVVLGSAAMKKWFPGLRAAPGQWQKGRMGEDVLITYSPDHILRFAGTSQNSPAVVKMKRELWNSLKGVKQRI